LALATLPVLAVAGRFSLPVSFNLTFVETKRYNTECELRDTLMI
jgi:hypothetical protein